MLSAATVDLFSYVLLPPDGVGMSLCHRWLGGMILIAALSTSLLLLLLAMRIWRKDAP